MIVLRLELPNVLSLRRLDAHLQVPLSVPLFSRNRTWPCWGFPTKTCLPDAHLSCATIVLVVSFVYRDDSPLLLTVKFGKLSKKDTLVCPFRRKTKYWESKETEVILRKCQILSAQVLTPSACPQKPVKRYILSRSCS